LKIDQERKAKEEKKEEDMSEMEKEYRRLQENAMNEKLSLAVAMSLQEKESANPPKPQE